MYKTLPKYAQQSFEIVEVVFQSIDKLTITIRGSVELWC